MKPEIPMEKYCFIDSPLGTLRLKQKGEALCELFRTEERPEGACVVEEKTPLLQKTIKQLEEYFAGERKVFSIPLMAEGTAFQQLAWQTLRGIPYGETISYGEEARRMQCRCARAVGSANGKNPIAIIIPCHRVINADGGIGGYTGGLDMKKYLLELEKTHR